MSLSDLNDVELLKVADPIMDNLMDASTHMDYAQHVRDFGNRAKASLDEAQFRRICEQYQRERGYFADRELLGVPRRPGSVIVVWVGVGTVGTAIYGMAFLGEEKGTLRLLCLFLIAAGIVGLKVLTPARA